METITVSKQRYAYWDNIKGVLITLVVFAHCLYAFQNSLLINTIVDCIYFFHMPAFVFVSGYFSKSVHSRSVRSLVKLFVAYLLLSAVHLLFAALADRELQIANPYYSSWYLLALIAWRWLTPYFSKIKGVIPLAIVVSFLAGFWPDINNTFALARMISFYPFFLAGYFLTKEKVQRLHQQPCFKRLPLGLGVTLLGGAVGAVTKLFLHPTEDDFCFNPYGDNVGVHMLIRAAIFTVAALVTVGLLCLIPNRKIPVLTKAGKNSLAIYLIHRPLTLIMNLFLARLSNGYIIAAASVFTILSLILLGSDAVAQHLDRLLLFFTQGIIALKSSEKKEYQKKVLALLLVLCILAAPVIHLASAFNSSSDGNSKRADYQNGVFRVADDEKEKRFQNAFRLLFAGDLLLLEDQVKNAYNGSGYDFSNCFEYTKRYIEDADLSIGVFEGPCAGNDLSTYSSGNFDDGKTLFLNFPDEWASAVKAAGFDLVTTANNHLLDRGEAGAIRTIDVLDAVGLDHTGSYRSATEKAEQRVKLVEKNGIRLAVLSYTNLVNGFSQNQMLEENTEYLTSMIVNRNNKHYEECLASVKQDFETARQLQPDFIVVLPHWGTQFEDEPDAFQLLWEENFKAFGADIILGDHTHSVQPVKMTTEQSGKSTFTLYCPGNYANIYREYNGDFSAMVEVYIDRTDKTILGGDIIPMWTESAYTGNYRALPIYEILTNDTLGGIISTRDMERVAAAQEHISSVMLGTELNLNLVQERYCFDEEGFFRIKNTSVELTDEMRDGVLCQALQNAQDVCFVGDSVTVGSRNGGVPWYEPMEALVQGKVTNCSWDGATIKTLLNEHMDTIAGADADLYVVAVGTNDVRYRDESICAMDENVYVRLLEELRNEILNVNSDAAFVFIAPWYSTDGDAVSKLDYPEKLEMNNAYSEALMSWADANCDGYVNANTYIQSVLDVYPHSDYLIDYIHPNATAGVELYATAVLKYSDTQ